MGGCSAERCVCVSVCEQAQGSIQCMQLRTGLGWAGFLPCVGLVSMGEQALNYCLVPGTMWTACPVWCGWV